MLNKPAIRLGSVAGIHIVVHRAWFLCFAGLTVWMALFTVPRIFPGWSQTDDWVLAALLVVGESATGFIHELGHSLVAVAHRRRVHSITLYGFAAATRRSASPQCGAEGVLIALAGPFSHFLVATIFWGAYLIMPAGVATISATLLLLALLNLAIGFVNLLPVAPLDGGRAVIALAAARRGVA
jgi:Zn-dependent protease